MSTCKYPKDLYVNLNNLRKFYAYFFQSDPLLAPLPLLRDLPLRLLEGGLIEKITTYLNSA